MTLRGDGYQQGTFDQEFTRKLGPAGARHFADADFLSSVLDRGNILECV